MNSKRVVIDAQCLLSALVAQSETGTEIEVYRGNFDGHCVSCNGIYLARYDEPYLKVRDDGSTEEVLAPDMKYYPDVSTAPPRSLRALHAPMKGEDFFWSHVPDYLACSAGLYVYLGKIIAKIADDVETVYQSVSPFDWRIGCEGTIFLRRGFVFFRITNQGREEKICESSGKAWGIGPEDKLVIRRKNALYCIADGIEQKFYESESDFDCRIDLAGIYIVEDISFYKLDYDGSKKEVCVRARESDSDDWQIGPEGIFFHLSDQDLLLLVVVK